MKLQGMADVSIIDDRTIPNEAIIWRRIHPNFIDWDDNLKARRPSSGAFQDSSNSSMSVIIAADVEKDGRSPLEILKNYPNHGIASITADLVRECKQIIVREPTVDEPAHAVVIGSKSKPIRRKLAQNADWVHLPPPENP